MDRYELSDAIELLEEIILKQEQKIRGNSYSQLVHEGMRLSTMYQILAHFKKLDKKKKSSAGTDDLE